MRLARTIRNAGTFRRIAIPNNFSDFFINLYSALHGRAAGLAALSTQVPGHSVGKDKMAFDQRVTRGRDCVARDDVRRLAEARVSRTHRCPKRTTAGFEDREDHRIPKRFRTTWSTSYRDVSMYQFEIDTSNLTTVCRYPRIHEQGYSPGCRRLALADTGGNRSETMPTASDCQVAGAGPRRTDQNRPH